MPPKNIFEPFFIHVLDSKLILFILFIIKKLRITTLGVILNILNRNDTILDLGCGESSPMAKLGRFNYSVGVDVSTLSLLKNKSKKPLSDYVCADLRFLPFKNKSYDYVLAFDVVEHFRKNDGYQFIRQAEAITKKLLIIQIPNGYCPTPYAKNDYEMHKSIWFTRDLENFGFFVLGPHGLKRLRVASEENHF